MGKGGKVSADEAEAREGGTTRFPWAGPALFVSVLVALIGFFVWFLRA
jgi:hypothetical protein